MELSGGKDPPPPRGIVELEVEVDSRDSVRILKTKLRDLTHLKYIVLYNEPIDQDHRKLKNY